MSLLRANLKVVNQTLMINFYCPENMTKQIGSTLTGYKQILLRARRHQAKSVEHHENRSFLASGKNHWHTPVYSTGSIGREHIPLAKHYY